MRLTSVTTCSVCSAKCLPLVVRGINVLLVVILVGANAFIFGVGVCVRALQAPGFPPVPLPSTMSGSDARR